MTKIIRSMPAIALLLALTSVFTAPSHAQYPQAEPAAKNPVMLSKDLLAKGWISLFDGETMFGWRWDPVSSKDQPRGHRFEIDNRTLICSQTMGVYGAGQYREGMIYTTGQFGNFELSFQYRMPVETNAQLHLRTSPLPDPMQRGYAIRLSNSDQGGIPNTGTIKGHFGSPNRRLGTTVSTQYEVDKSPDWHTMIVRADGGKITVEIDLQPINEYADPNPLGRGYIGFQCHGGRLELRNIMLRPLGMKSLFNGKDLTGWNTFPDLPTKATVTPDGFLRIQDGNGMIETKDSFDDFTFQTEINIQVENVNSGLFFRCIPGEKMNGYESQVNNEFLDGDRTKPADCGTGGIFRRMSARQIVAGNKEWFFMTIHADDKHMATWVNGVQVCDFSDFREPDPNPRKGLRQEAGTIQIQGHDPTTDVLYRNLQIAPVPERRP